MTMRSDALTPFRSKAALGFIFVTALLDIVALGIMIPVLPNLIKSFLGGSTVKASHSIMLFAISWGLMQFICSPLQGLLSDRFGRRPVLLVSIFGLGTDYLFMAFAPNLAWLYIGRLINGATAASFSTANAYIADITTPDNRAKSYGLMGAAFGIGFILGPLIGGTLGAYNLRWPFYFSAALALTNWLYGYFILPESLSPEKRKRKINWSQANPLGALAFLRQRQDLFGFSIVYFLFQLVHNVFPSIFVLFVGHRFGWGPREAAYMLVATGILNAVVQGGLTSYAVKWLGEKNMVLLGFGSAACAFFIYALAPNPLVFCSGVIFSAMIAFVGPGLQGLMTRQVGVSEQGQLQGINSAIMGIAAIIGPLLYLSLFSFALDNDKVLHFSGLPIFFAALLCLFGLLLASQISRPVFKKKNLS